MRLTSIDLFPGGAYAAAISALLSRTVLIEIYGKSAFSLLIKISKPKTEHQKPETMECPIRRPGRT